MSFLKSLLFLDKKGNQNSTQIFVTLGCLYFFSYCCSVFIYLRYSKSGSRALLQKWWRVHILLGRVYLFRKTVVRKWWMVNEISTKLSDLALCCLGTLLPSHLQYYVPFVIFLDSKAKLRLALLTSK